MGEFDIDTNFNVKYTKWENAEAQKLAKKSDKDKVEGLNTVEEILNFFRRAEKKKIDVSEIFGLELSAKTRQAQSTERNIKTEYSKQINYFNSLDYDTKSEITYRANNIGREILYQLEKDINQAFENCEGYRLIKLHRDWHEDKSRFNFEEVQRDVTIALNSVNELQKNLEKAYNTAKGIEGTIPEPVDYNAELDNIAQQKLGMSYEDFVKENKDLLYITDSVNYSDAYNPQYEYYDFYKKALEYKKAVTKYARETLQDTRTNSGERLLEETVKYSNASVELIDFAYDDTISKNSIKNLSSDIMRKAFLEAIDENAEKTDIQTPETKQTNNRNRKVMEGHNIIIKTPYGDYNTNGTIR